MVEGCGWMGSAASVGYGWAGLRNSIGVDVVQQCSELCHRTDPHGGCGAVSR